MSLLITSHQYLQLLPYKKKSLLVCVRRRRMPIVPSFNKLTTTDPLNSLQLSNQSNKKLKIRKMCNAMVWFRVL